MADTLATADEIKKLSKDEQTLIDALEKLNVVSLNNVVKYMEQTYGISAAPAAVVSAAPAGADASGGEAAAQKSTYDIELTETGPQKIAVIKAVREVTQLGLGEAKAKVDSAPQVIREGVPKEEAEAAKAKLEAAGAKVTLK